MKLMYHVLRGFYMLFVVVPVANEIRYQINQNESGILISKKELPNVNITQFK